jgi:predicted nucleic acid-binding protein
MAVLVDANVLIDIATADPVWAGWSDAALSRALDQGQRLLINPIIYAEVSVAYLRIEELDAALPEAVFGREDLPWAAGFLAGKAYLSYRRRGGLRTSPLPDFYIGAHAAIAGHALLTRDRARHALAFPALRLIAPD